MKRTLIILMTVLLAFAFISCAGDSSPVFRTISFETNGGSEIESQIVLLGQKAEKPESPTKEGFIFDNWYQTADCSGPAYDFSQKVVEDTVLYAKWESTVFTDSDYLKFCSLGYLTIDFLYYVYPYYYHCEVTDESHPPIIIENIFDVEDEWENIPKDDFYFNYGDLDSLIFLKDKIGPDWLGDIDEVTDLDIKASGTMSFPVNTHWDNEDYYHYQSIENKRIIVDSIYSGKVNYVDLNGNPQTKDNFRFAISYTFEGSSDYDHDAGINEITWSVTNLKINGYDFGYISYHWENAIESISLNGKNYEGYNESGWDI